MKLRHTKKWWHFWATRYVRHCPASITHPEVAIRLSPIYQLRVYHTGSPALHARPHCDRPSCPHCNQSINHLFVSDHYDPQNTTHKNFANGVFIGTWHWRLA